ncbi:MAG: Rho termination factor N-terminal domain-containing protein [Chloroflexota bacterium]|jgi:hypothetical protein
MQDTKGATGLSTRDIQKLARQAGVNKPVMSVRVVGNRVELHLLGGEVVPLSTTRTIQNPREAKTGQDATEVKPTTPQDILADMTVSRLKKIAAFLEMSGYSRLKKQKLIDEMIQHFDDEQLQSAIFNTA